MCKHGHSCAREQSYRQNFTACVLCRLITFSTTWTQGLAQPVSVQIRFSYPHQSSDTAQLNKMFGMFMENRWESLHILLVLWSLKSSPPYFSYKIVAAIPRTQIHSFPAARTFMPRIRMHRAHKIYNLFKCTLLKVLYTAPMRVTLQNLLHQQCVISCRSCWNIS